MGNTRAQRNNCPHWKAARANNLECPVAPPWAEVKQCFFEPRERKTDPPSEHRECAWYWRWRYYQEAGKNRAKVA